MKPRSSTEIFASSSGRKLPLRYTVMKNVSVGDVVRVLDGCIGAALPMRRVESLEPQSNGVPRAPEETRERHLLQGNQRVDGLQRELQLRRLALGQRHVLVDDEARGHRVRHALPYLESADLRAVLIELHRVVEL